MRIAIIGAGSWGTALAVKACQGNGDNETILYNRSPLQAKLMQETRKNPEYLTHVTLPEKLTITSSLELAMNDAQLVLVVTPSVYVRETIERIKMFCSHNTIVVCCSKGLERNTGLRMSQVLSEVLQGVTDRIAILSGPNHAEEVAVNLPAATVIGSLDENTAKVVQTAMNSEYFRVYSNSDIIGVELGGTTKNIIALAAGIADGMELGDNCKAALLTRGLHEITRFGVFFGAKRETYAGLTGMGDLVATCMSMNSRNRAAGAKLAQGLTVAQIVESTNMVVEGFYAVPAVFSLAQKYHIDMPITEALCAVLEGHISPGNALLALMTREPKTENI